MHQIKQMTGHATAGNVSPNDHRHKKLETSARLSRIEKPTATSNEDTCPRYQRPGNPGQPHKIIGPHFTGVLRHPYPKHNTRNRWAPRKYCPPRFHAPFQYQSPSKIRQSQSFTRFGPQVPLVSRVKLPQGVFAEPAKSANLFRFFENVVSKALSRVSKATNRRAGPRKPVSNPLNCKSCECQTGRKLHVDLPYD